MIQTCRSQRGFLLAEMIVALTVLAALLISFALALHGFKQFNHYQWMRQQCLAAAGAQLDCLSVTRSPLSEEDLKRLWPRVTLVTSRTQGLDQWEGLDHYRVTGQAPSFHRVVKVTLARYGVPLRE